MKREDKVISLELSKKLHELGVRVDSEWWWISSGGLWVMCQKRNDTYWCLITQGFVKAGGNIQEQYPAYDTAELGEMLPYRTRLEDDDYWLRIFKLKHGDFELRYTSTKPSLSGLMGQDLSGIIQAKTEAEARGKMLSWLIENNYVKGEEL